MNAQLDSFFNYVPQEIAEPAPGEAEVPIEPDPTMTRALQKLEEKEAAFGLGRTAGIRSLSATHEQIINWLILNPQMRMRDCAAHFGITQSWLSMIVHSDAFKAKMQQRQDELFAQVAQSVPAKLTALADISIEKLTEMVEKTENAQLVVDVFDKTLHRLGYAPQKVAAPAAPAVQMNFSVSRDDLAAARAMIVQPQPQLPAPIHDLHSNDNPVGATIEHSAPVC